MSHILVITESADFDPADPEWNFVMECDRVGCDLWVECIDGVHLIKYEYRDGDEIEHGILHREVQGVWCVPYRGCAYTENAMEDGGHWVIARDHGSGRYVVDIDWYGDFSVAALVLVGREQVA
jgi:hypothetical protein